MTLMSVLSGLWLLGAAVLAVPLLMLCLQVAAFFFSRGNPPAVSQRGGERFPVAVLVPAHNEESGIAATVANLQQQGWPDLRICVIADNCSDATAERARACGAEVFERHDLERRGKGYALDFGMRRLAASRPEVVMIVDADCQLAPAALAALCTTAMQSGRPVQARYVLHLPDGASVKQKIAAFAWEVKVHVRSLGSRALGAPNQLLGTGMAFPWHTLAEAELASGHLAEDAKLGVELALKGVEPLFLDSATVTSAFPEQQQSSDTQHQRWEQGHLSVMREFIPALLRQWVAQRRGSLALAAVDLSVPPLALFLMLITLWAALGLALFLFGGGQWLLPAALSGPLALGIAVLLAWAAVGRDKVSIRELLGIPFYVLRKLPLYVRAAAGRGARGWVRTDRNTRQ